MKKNYFFYFFFFLLLLAIVGCTTDTDNAVIPEEGTELEQTTTEFTKSDVEAGKYYNWTSSYIGTWYIQKMNGLIGQINYGNNPNPEPPKSPEEFFKDNMPMTNDDEMKEDGWLYNGTVLLYRQYYKGIPVEQGTMSFWFSNNMIRMAAGHFVVIDNLDVIPLISEVVAKKIVENFIKDSVEGEYKRFYLAIMEFPNGETLIPRLVYVYKHDLSDWHNYVYVDAKSGRLLYQRIYSNGEEPYT
jgi:hypothetical protein